MLKINNYTLNYEEDLLIAHFSDIHYSKHFDDKILDELSFKLKELTPNYICITGDIIDNLGITYEKEMTKLLNFLDDLSKDFKLIISLGNNDTRD